MGMCVYTYLNGGSKLRQSKALTLSFSVGEASALQMNRNTADPFAKRIISL